MREGTPPNKVNQGKSREIKVIKVNQGKSRQIKVNQGKSREIKGNRGNRGNRGIQGEIRNPGETRVSLW